MFFGEGTGYFKESYSLSASHNIEEKMGANGSQFPPFRETHNELKPFEIKKPVGQRGNRQAFIFGS